MTTAKKSITNLLSVLITLPTIAQAEISGYCFLPKVSLQQAKGHLTTILAPADKIFFRESQHCLEVKTQPARHELYQKFLKSKFTLIHVYQNNAKTSLSVPLTQKICHVELTQIKEVNSNFTNLGGKFKKGKTKEKKKTTANIYILSGREGSIQVDPYKFIVKCRATAKDYYQLNFRFEETNASSISSSVSLRKGEMLNIGGVVEDLKKQYRELGLSNDSLGFAFNKQDGIQQTEAWITVR